jgi:hypothetical protein
VASAKIPGQRQLEPIKPPSKTRHQLLEWVDWFNNRRLLEPIANIPPAEAEQRYFAMLEQPQIAA